jgi:hypothetical protein
LILVRMLQKELKKAAIGILERNTRLQHSG